MHLYSPDLMLLMLQYFCFSHVLLFVLPEFFISCSFFSNKKVWICGQKNAAGAKRASQIEVE